MCDVDVEALLSRGAGSVLHLDPNVTIKLRLMAARSGGWRSASMGRIPISLEARFAQ
jgi:hypothetical protein